MAILPVIQYSSVEDGVLLPDDDVGPQVRTQFQIQFVETVNLTLTAQVNAEDFLGGSNRNITKADLTDAKQYRLVARVAVGSASANVPRIYARFSAAVFSTTLSDYSAPLGDAGDVPLSLTTAGHVETAWTALNEDAKADVFLTLLQHGGDASASPVLRMVAIQFR